MNQQASAEPVLMACDLQDYVEIACMFHYQIQLELKSGETFIGRALTTRLNSAREECMLLAREDTQANEYSEIDIPLSSLHEMLVLTKQARFQRVTFD